jgi:hypothetical protein
MHALGGSRHGLRRRYAVSQFLVRFHARIHVASNSPKIREAICESCIQLRSMMFVVYC